MITSVFRTQPKRTIFEITVLTFAPLATLTSQLLSTRLAVEFMEWDDF